MGQYDALVDRLFPSPADRLVAMSFVERFAGSPLADRIIPAMLQEGAQVNARISAGEITPQAGRHLMIATAPDCYGPPPHIVQDVQVWATDIGRRAGGEADAPPTHPATPPAALINNPFA